MRERGWYDRPGVKIIKGKWLVSVHTSQKRVLISTRQDAVEELNSIGGFDVVYTDTFSEDYKQLREFFELLPDLLSGPDSRFGFFNGLGATSELVIFLP